jgi:hypothetical protein
MCISIHKYICLYVYFNTQISGHIYLFEFYYLQINLNAYRAYLSAIHFLTLLIFFRAYAFLAGLYGNIWYRFLTPSFVIYIRKHHHHHYHHTEHLD